jgi:hypothetical protein
MSQLLDPDWERASFLPVGRNRKTGKLGMAVPQVAADLLSALMLPGDVYKGNVLMNDPATGHTSDEVIRRSADLASNLTLGTTGATGAARVATGKRVVDPNVVNIFAGPTAKTADHAALKVAQELAEKGVSRDEIWKNTGWFKGIDGKWKFEIDDSRSVFGNINPEPQTTPIRAALKHPELYNAYPEFIPITVREETMGKAHGRFYGGEGTPEIGVSWSAKDPKSTLLHELQHGVQAREGFGKGDGGFMLREGSPAWEIYREIKRKMLTPQPIDEYARNAGFASVKEAEKSYKQYVRDIKKSAATFDRQAQETAVEQAYKRASGEVESRNVQTRMDMTADQRRAKAPWETQDVPDAQQIVGFR